MHQGGGGAKVNKTAMSVSCRRILRQPAGCAFSCIECSLLREQLGSAGACVCGPRAKGQQQMHSCLHMLQG